MSGSLSDYPPQRDTPGMAIATEKLEESRLEAVAEQENHDDSVGDDSKDTNNKEGVALKNRRKKKKAKKTAHEDDDIDKILAELGEAPPLLNTAAALQQEEPSPTQAERVISDNATVEMEVGEKVVESVALKKKKKRREKEKEKEKKAGSLEAAPALEEKQEDPKNKAADKKKVPKIVRELQEKIAKDKEEKERKRREEEERLRKEEEERLKQEEFERQAEEEKLLKKQRQKEKLLKKKQEGRPLTRKQKEEARRREARRSQLLGTAGDPSATTGESAGAPAKRPLYQRKKSKLQLQTNSDATAETTDNTEGEIDVTDVIEEDGAEEEDYEEEWHVRSWDFDNLKLLDSSAILNYEIDSKPKSVLEKDAESPHHSPCDAKPSMSTHKVSPEKCHGIDCKINWPMGKVAANIKHRGGTGENKSPRADSENLRSPICCIMGHVDAGKTKLLDCIRGTNVQGGEAGGITQQIGATYFPVETLRQRTKELKADAKIVVPGLLVIDTPGHDSFRNLRSRGSGLCDIAILVVDINQGMQRHTIESLNLLRMRNTEFIIALNKVDRLYGWKTCRNAPIVKALKQQSEDVRNEFNRKVVEIVTQFKEQGLNTELYYKNKEMGETFSIVPTSAISGEGIPDILLLLVQWSQKTMVEKLMYNDKVQCTVLEVKLIDGLGTTIDVVLVNGVLHEGDQIVVCGMQGPIVTTIKALSMPHALKELRLKGEYLHYKEIKAAQGIRITAQGLEHAIAGTSLNVVGPNDDLDDIIQTTMEDMESVMSRIDKTGEGVFVQSSTLGSLEALLDVLKTNNIPVSAISIGPVNKKDVIKARAMLDKKKEYAAILAFDVKVIPEARKLADEFGVKIFVADIIYHLHEQIEAYVNTIKEEKKVAAAKDVVFPCVLKIKPNCVFSSKDPIILGVDVLEGIAKIGTPICIPTKNFIDIGSIASIKMNDHQVDSAKKGQTVSIKIIGSNSDEKRKMFGRHFAVEDELVSRLSRRSIDLLKEHYRDEVSKDEWKLVAKLKKLLNIP